MKIKNNLKLTITNKKTHKSFSEIIDEILPYPDKIYKIKNSKLEDCVSAVQWNGYNIEEIENFIGEPVNTYGSNPNLKLLIYTLAGDMYADTNDFIIKGIEGEFYPCKPDIFEMTYEKVSE